MNINTGTQYIKNKFATLLSKMVTDARLGYNEITNKLIENEFLDCFEKNDISIIYDKSYETIIYNLFKKECLYSEGIDPVVYWCGEQYINIFLNKRIPLKQLLLMCPLKQIESYYNIYHEQNESKFVEMFMDEMYKESILKRLRNKRGYSARELSVLSSISINTIKYYENNQNLYKASYENINKLLTVLEYSDSLIKKKTNYIPELTTIFNIKEINNHIKEYVRNYFDRDIEIEYNTGVFWIKGKNNKRIDNKVVDAAVVDAIENYKEDKLLF